MHEAIFLIFYLEFVLDRNWKWSLNDLEGYLPDLRKFHFMTLYIVVIF